MPISFPQPKRGAPWTWPENLVSAAARAYAQAGTQYVPNLLSPDPKTPFKLNNFGGLVLPAQTKAPNLRRLGTVFVNPDRPPNNQVPLLVRFPVIAQQTGTLVWRLTGVSRDSAGAQLGFCTVKVFQTANDEKVAEVVSDATGNWSVEMLRQGPFYLVEYLIGSPDRAGTSLNTLVPVQLS